MTDRAALSAILAARLAGEGIESETASYLANTVASRATFDALGVVVDLGAIVASVKSENLDLLATTPAASDQALTGTPLDREMRAARDADESDRLARVQAVRDAANPWKHGTGFNITRQAILENADPHLAARLRAEVGA